MSLDPLPHKLPFNLGGLVRPAEVKASGFTGVLPNRLPFSLSAQIDKQEVPFGSVGWELVCRSHDDFQTILLRTADMTGLSFTKELNAFGLATINLDLDHPVFNQTLNNGYSVEALFDYENLWEIRFDDRVIFQALGTAETDSTINQGETRTVSITATGIGRVLEWASVYPQGFPDNILTKLENLKDEFGGDQVNSEIWPVSSGASYSNIGARLAAEEEVANLQQDRVGLIADRNSAQADFNAERSEYYAVMRDKTSTAKEKSEALKKVDLASHLYNRSLIALTDNQKAIDRANLIKNFIGPIKVDDSSARLKLTLNEAGTRYITSGLYNFSSSGISVGVEPAPSTSAADGQASTILRIAYSSLVPSRNAAANVNVTFSARMYTQRISGNLRLVAEVINNNIVKNEEWSYNVNSQKYWRIREDSGYIVFETSPDNLAWTERFRSEFNWPGDMVVAQLGISLIGNVGIAPPLSAHFFELNKSTLPATEAAMELYRELLEASQARGVIPYVKLGFTDTHDSRGLPWEGKPAVEILEGTKLSNALKSLTAIQQADWYMDADFTLKVYQKTKTDTVSPPAYFTKKDVVFHEGGSQLTKDRTRNREAVANSIVGKNAAGEYAIVEDSTSISKFQKREAFISAGNANDLNALSQVLDASLQELKEEQSSWRVTVDFDQPGRRPFKDYDIGDWIFIENVDSRGDVSVAQWRVVGIAVQLSDNGTTVELTLQSRMELLAERLKAQVENLSASSISGGVNNLGTAISASTLIQQATLAGLKDVVIGAPIEGDVLTFAGGYWSPIAPGDKTIPGVPEFLTVFSNVYYPEDGISVKAQAEVTWTLPVNTDGSFITDGHHFELRYRPDVSADYPATWGTLETENWDQSLTWAQPAIPPITNAGWQNVYAGWDEQSTVIQEMTPGLTYQLQIRAVDSSTPQHFSDWSGTYTFTTNNDTVAPGQPAPPIVASSMLGVQVTHYLGQASGGTFNLPPDMAYLEVHAGGPSFYPNDTTRIGKIIADQGLIRSQTPVIQSFSLDSTDNIWIRVIAVDTAGNKSSPSTAATATVTLIDDAHISDLTASKITAGTISSSIILAGVIKTADTGARAEMNYEGFRIFSEENDPTVSLLGNPSTNGNFLLIKDLEDASSTLAGIDGTGRGSFQSITVASDITMGGDLLREELIDPIGKGVVSIGYYDSGSVIGGGPMVERGFLEISFIAEEARTYMICGTTEWDSTANADKITMRFRDGGENTPSISSPLLQQNIISTSVGAINNTGAMISYAGTFTPGLHRILWTFYANEGNAKIAADTGIGAVSPTVFWVEDVGTPKTDTILVNDGGIDEYQAAPDPSKPTTTPRPKVQYTKNYACSWSGTYRSNGAFSASHGNSMVQGDSGSDSWLNDARSLCGFNYAQIMKDLKGATIKACYITLYANHWYWNDGGTARIGTHNYTGRPSTWSGSRVDEQRVSSPNWPKPGKRKVSLGTTIGNEFKSGVAKGIALGPTNGNKTQYGRFNGNGQANEPVLTIVYVK